MSNRRVELFIFTSNDCNLGCSYCSVLNSPSQKFPVAPQYKVDQLIKFIIDLSKKLNKTCVDIFFFGGEPTLNTTYIEEIISNTLKFKGIAFRYILHTNGLLLHTLSDLILSNLSSIIVSINYEKIPNKNLEGSYFGKVIDNVRKTKERKNIAIMARLTITENVSLYNNVVQVASFFDSIYWQIQNCESFDNFDTYFHNYKYELRLLWEYWNNYIEKGVVLNLLPFVAPFTLKNEITKSLGKYLCGYNDFMFYIQTNGECYSCAEEILDSEYFNIGNIYEGIKIKVKKPDFLVETCNKCTYYFYCQGRCGRMQERFSKNHIEEYCQLSKELFELVSSNYEQVATNKVFMEYIKKIDNLMLGMTEYLP